jgi:outer membrane protein, multidrug efflux system
MMSRSLSSVAATLFLAGCMLGPDYQRPAMNLPADYPEQAAPAATGSNAAGSSPALARGWWKVFGDPALDDLVDQALANNTDVAAAAARIEEAQGLLREVAGAEWPEVDLEAAGSRQRSSQSTATTQPGIPAFRNDFLGRVGTSFELDIWGKLRRASESARADVLATRNGRDTVELTLVGTVVSTYLDLRGLDAQLAVTRETLASREASQRIVERRRQAGLATALEASQAEAATHAVRAQIAEFTRARAVAEHLLGRLTGDLTLAIPPGDLRQLPEIAAVPAGLPSALLEERPDVRQAEAQLISANARIGVAKAALFPSISLTGGVGTQSKDLSNLFTGPASIWSLGLTLDLPIFDAGQRAARVDQVTARQKQALASYTGTVRGAFTEVRDALVSIDQQGQREAAQAAQMQAANRALALAQRRYEAGYSPYLEVLDAQRTAHAATLLYVNARHDRLAAAVSLYAALGGGWSTPAPLPGDTAAR